MDIYLATNLINGKQYVGKTVFEMETRQSKHISNLNTAKKRHYPLYSAIKKYGKENFSWEVIDHAETEEELNTKEKYWIGSYDTLSPNGYNLTLGGDGQTGYKHSEESKKKISQNNYWNGRPGINAGKTFSEEHRKNLSAAHKGKPNNIVYDDRLINILREQKLGDKNPMYGKTSPRIKAVINLDTMQTYISLTEAQKQTNIQWTNIRKVCIQERNTAGGFRWMFYDEYMSIPSQAENISEGVTTIRKE